MLDLARNTILRFEDWFSRILATLAILSLGAYLLNSLTVRSFIREIQGLFIKFVF